MPHPSVYWMECISRPTFLLSIKSPNASLVLKNNESENSLKSEVYCEPQSFNPIWGQRAQTGGPWEGFARTISFMKRVRVIPTRSQVSVNTGPAQGPS